MDGENDGKLVVQYPNVGATCAAQQEEVLESYLKDEWEDVEPVQSLP